MSDDTRRCIECGETKPLDQFHAWSLNQPRELVCFRCRGWDDDRPLQEQLREHYQRRMAERERLALLMSEEREQERLAALTPEGVERARLLARKREKDERRYLEQLRDYYKREAAHKKEWEPIRAQRRDEYRAWAHGLLESGLTPDDVRLIAKLESWIFRRGLNWPRIRTTFEKVDPPYTRRTLRRKSLSPRLRLEIYEQYQARCYYCGCAVTPPDQPYNGSPEYVEVRKAYRTRLREIKERRIWATTREENQFCDRLRHELYNSELRQRFLELDDIHQQTASTFAHIDHRLPVVRGGSDDRSNLVLACLTCNLSKHTQTAEEFKGMETVGEAEAVPVDPVWELSGLMKLEGPVLELDAIFALYRAEQKGYKVLPLTDGYLISLIGNIGPDGHTTENAKWRARAYRRWYNDQKRLHNWQGEPRPPKSLEYKGERIRQLKRIAKQEVRDVLRARGAECIFMSSI